MYIAQGQWQPPGDKILIATKKFNNLIIHYQFQPLGFNTFCEKVFTTLSSKYKNRLSLNVSTAQTYL